ncbi:alpha/beta hydrolase [Halioxenophilus aromaticivorans]|uniref:Phospholipase/carboxylesterase n=1 Tax=Halioxenophilus aromaticivorans TaxID=1306992 RepID=A0AAV3U2D6_9ALTE
MAENYLPAIEVETGENITASVIWLHGLGASGHDFEPIVPHLGFAKQQGVRFVFPHAPQRPVTINNGVTMPAWYDILSMSLEREVDSAQLRQSAEQTIALVEREIARGVPSERIVLAGFSQGGAVVYEAALSFSKPLAGLMVLSSYFATADSIDIAEANKSIPILVCHGTHDPVVPEQLGQQAVAHLKQAGYSTDYKTYPMDHSVSMPQIQDISTWLGSVLPA